MTDPYESGAFGGALALGPIKDEADIVTISHDHADHSAADVVPGDPIVLRDAGTAKDIQFSVVDVYHDDSQGSERGENKIFVFTVDALTVAHCGDLGHELDSGQTDKLKALGVDVLIVPVGGFYTIDAATADSVVKQVSPSIAIPMHVKTDKVNFPIAPMKDYINNKSNVKKIGDSTVEMTEHNLPETTEIWVLEPSN